MTERFVNAMAAIDRVHAEDPRALEIDGASRPVELVYAERMTAALAELVEAPSEALSLAVRAQHLGRWRVPRSTYPEGRRGYLRWRADAGRAHAELAASLIASAGYEQDFVDAVWALVAKRDRSPDGQALEDAACLVFLRYELTAFARDRDRDKVLEVLRQTWRKMSEMAHARALEIASARPWLDAARGG